MGLLSYYMYPFLQDVQLKYYITFANSNIISVVNVVTSTAPNPKVVNRYAMQEEIESIREIKLKYAQFNVTLDSIYTYPPYFVPLMFTQNLIENITCESFGCSPCPTAYFKLKILLDPKLAH